MSDTPIPDGVRVPVPRETSEEHFDRTSATPATDELIEVLKADNERLEFELQATKDAHAEDLFASKVNAELKTALVQKRTERHAPPKQLILAAQVVFTGAIIALVTAGTVRIASALWP